jgi:uncharacterized protein (DUF302 family)
MTALAELMGLAGPLERERLRDREREAAGLDQRADLRERVDRASGPTGRSDSPAPIALLPARPGAPLTCRRDAVGKCTGMSAELVTKVASHSVEDVVARLTSIAESRGMKVFAVIDHSGEASRAGLELRDTKVVIFGSPLAGTAVMVAAPLAALDLPLKVLVWADGSQTKLTYTSPAALAARYQLSDEFAGRLAGVDGLTDAVIQA